MSIDFRRVDSYTLAYKIGALLLDAMCDHPGQLLYLQQELAELGITTTTEEVHAAVCKLRRRGWFIIATERQPSYCMIGMKTQLRTWSRRPVPQISLLGR